MLDLLRVVGDEHRLFEDLLGQIALMLGLQIGAPLDLVLEVVVVLLQQLYGIGVAYAGKLGVCDQLQPLDQPLSKNWLKKASSSGQLSSR